MVRGLFLHVNYAAAAFRSTSARYAFDLIGKPVIHGQFLAGLDRPLAPVEYMPTYDARPQIGVATVIDNLRAAAAHRAVEGPVVVQSEQVGEVALPADLGLAPADALAGVFHNFAPCRNSLQSVDAAAVDFGRPDFQLEAGVPRVDDWGFHESRGHDDGFSAL